MHQFITKGGKKKSAAGTCSTRFRNREGGGERKRGFCPIPPIIWSSVIAKERERERATIVI